MTPPGQNGSDLNARQLRVLRNAADPRRSVGIGDGMRGTCLALERQGLLERGNGCSFILTEVGRDRLACQP